MNDEHDAIIDAGLEEVLGGSHPPDLSAAIMSEWVRRCATSVPVSEGVTASLPPTATPRPQLIQPATQSTRSSRRGLRSSQKWILSLAGWASVAAAVVIVIVTLNSTEQPTQPAKIARTTPFDQQRNDPAIPPAPAADGSVTQPKENSVAEAPAIPDLPKSDHVAVSPNEAVATSHSIDSAPTNSVITNIADELKRRIPDAQVGPKKSDLEIVTAIDSALVRYWQTKQVGPPHRVADEVWWARVYESFLGRAPTTGEISQLAGTQSFSERALRLDKLMQDESFSVELARNWSDSWTRLLMDPSVEVNSEVASRDGLRQFIRRSFMERRPFDAVVTELISATGSGVPGAVNYNGAANFFASRVDADHVTSTVDMSRLFLGRSVECQQCHDGPRWSDGRQQEFWELNTFLRQVAIRRDKENGRAELADVAMESPGSLNAKEVFFRLPDGTLKMATASFGGQPLWADVASMPGFDRRAALARWMVTSSDFRRNIVNRIWQNVVGEAFVPVDRIRQDSDLSPLLAELGDQFAAHDFDVRAVMRWAMLSLPAFAPSNVPGPRAQLARFDRFRGHLDRKSPSVTPETFLSATTMLATAMGPATTAARLSPVETIRNQQAMSISATDFDYIPQADIDPIDDSIAEQIMVHPRLTLEQKAEHLFQMEMHRLPNRRERMAMDELLAVAPETPRTALEMLWFSLRNPAAVQAKP